MQEKDPSPPLQAILISPDAKDREKILGGTLNVTIREGWRKYSEDLVMLCCSIEPFCVRARITKVRRTYLNEVSEEEMFAAGYSTQSEMLYILKQKYYPALTLESKVTVVRWDDVEGKLVDNYRKRISSNNQ